MRSVLLSFFVAVSFACSSSAEEVSAAAPAMDSPDTTILPPDKDSGPAAVDTPVATPPTPDSAPQPVPSSPAAAQPSEEKVDTAPAAESPSTPPVSETEQPAGQPANPEPSAPAPTVSKVDHSGWDQLLRSYVDAQGHVNYQGFLEATGRLDTYLSELAAATPTSSWSRNEAMAYWINAYNAFTVKLILDHWPVSTILDIDNGDPWNVKWIQLGGESYSLNQIENDILRPRYGDARIHFAVNCAAKSCPPLLNRAFLPDKLDQQLERQTRQFINDATYNEIRPNTVRVSKIFDWYKEDFGDLIDYLNQYSSTTIQDSAEIRFRNYNWSLNN